MLCAGAGTGDLVYQMAKQSTALAQQIKTEVGFADRFIGGQVCASTCRRRAGTGAGVLIPREGVAGGVTTDPLIMPLYFVRAWPVA
eukprot:3016790-Rhodomonas_salina.1